MRFRIFVFFIFALFVGTEALQASGVVNGDFETGSLSSWNVTLGGPMAYSSPTAMVVGAGFAPNTNNNLSQVYAGSYSCALYSGAGDFGHQDFARIAQDLYVDPSTVILQFDVAAVLNGAHATTPGEDAYFQVSVVNGGGPLISQTYFYAASPAPLVDDGVAGWRHLPWTTLTFNLGAYVGTTVTVQFEVHDCNLSGHYCYAYVDGFQLVPTFTISPTYSISPTLSASPTPTCSATADFSATDSPTTTPSPSNTATPSDSATATVSPSSTVSPTASPTSSVTPTPTYSPSCTITATFSMSPTFSVSPTITPTFTHSPSFTASLTPVHQSGPVEIHSVYPNPFSEWVHGALVLKAAGTVDIRVYNVAGEPVYTEARPAVAGVNVWDWNGRNNGGARLASGAYIIRVSMRDARGPPSYIVVAVMR